MADNPELPRWRGIHHLALITTDMDATTRFYHEVLGARLVATIGTPAFRHYFFEVGAGNTIAFFEYRDTEQSSTASPSPPASPTRGPCSSTICRSTSPTSRRSNRCVHG
jgi:catechol 2,3-dioxygenase-like lactoylglutathione lyase family enzyme